MNDYFKNLSLIFLEADGEEDTQADDYSMDPSVSELGDDIDNQDTEEEGTEEEQTENPEGEGDEESLEGTEEDSDYSMDGENPEGEEGMDQEMEDSEESMEEEEDNTDENYKKYKLLQVYRNLISDVMHLVNSINKLQDNIDSDLREHSLFIENKLKELKDKCSFTIQHEFLNKPYTELLTSFLYFKKELEEILNLIEKIIKYNKE